MEGFVQIHPAIDYETFCPQTGTVLRAVDWTVPGLWTMAKLQSQESGATYWTDLPSGVGLLGPCFIDVATGEVERPASGRWYADLTRAAWRAQGETAVTVRVERRRRARRACLVNCLHPNWGDAVSLLLRINELRDRTDLDLVVLATTNLEWLIPDFVAEAWLVDGGLSATARWNTALARQVKTLVAGLDACFIPVTFQPASLSADEVAEFSRVAPFARAKWSARLQETPTVTFVARTDRCWSRDPEAPRPIYSQLARSPYLRGIARFQARRAAARALRDQGRRVAALAERLRQQIPAIDFAVMGLGTGPPLAPWIADLRRDAIAPGVERDWCARAARSHVIIGVHGSHMLLPSGHAGAVIELLPRARLGNVLQDLLVPADDPREAVYCCRLVPLDTDSGVVAEMVVSLLYNYPWAHLSYHRRYAGPQPMVEVGAMRARQRVRADAVRASTAEGPLPFFGP